MLPGARFTPRAILRGLFRRTWLIVATLVVGASAATFWPASMPESCRGETALIGGWVSGGPFRPECARPSFIGAAVGLLLGLVVATGLAYRDSSFRQKADLVRVLSLPVLAVVPEIKTGFGRRPRRRRALVIAAASAILVGLAAAIAWWRLQL